MEPTAPGLPEETSPPVSQASADEADSPALSYLQLAPHGPSGSA